MQTIPSHAEMYAALEERHGKELQKRLSEARVAICGLGGLGSNIAVCLARAGVGHLHLIDFDCVDISNLNRQQDNLRAIAPYCEISTDTVMLTADNAPALLKDDQIICEAFDKAENKAVLVNCVLENMPEKPLVAASGMAGIGSANTIRTRKVMKNFYLCGDGATDVDDNLGLYGARVLVCAAHQATMILRLIDGADEP